MMPLPITPTKRQYMRLSADSGSNATRRWRPWNFATALATCWVVAIGIEQGRTAYSSIKSSRDDFNDRRRTPPYNSNIDSRRENLQRLIDERQERRRETRVQHNAVGRHEALLDDRISPELDVPEEELFDFNIPPVKTTFTLPDPTNATAIRDETLMIIVMSARNHFMKRDAIRQSWAKNHSVVFVVGGIGSITREFKNSTYMQWVQAQLTMEATQYGDILDAVHPESYSSLPWKLRYGYKWVLDNGPKTIQWILKVDDDMMVRVDTLKQVLLLPLNGHVPMVVGHIMRNSPVHRDGKWAETKTKFAPDTYPLWPQGSFGHVVSRPVADYVTNMPRPVTYYQGEDTSLGIWLDGNRNMTVLWIDSPYFANHRNCHQKHYLVVGHDITPSEMRECTANADEWEDDAKRDKLTNFWMLKSFTQQERITPESAW